MKFALSAWLGASLDLATPIGPQGCPRSLAIYPSFQYSNDALSKASRGDFLHPKGVAIAAGSDESSEPIEANEGENVTLSIVSAEPRQDHPLGAPLNMCARVAITGGKGRLGTVFADRRSSKRRV
jgi:hypothetical protein